MVYNTWKTAYLKESTWNTDPIANKTTQTYWIGVHTDQFPLPEPINVFHFVTPGPGSRERADTIRTQTRFAAMNAIVLQNAHLIYFALGKEAVSASGSYYVHTLTPTGNATTGVCAERPSLCFHHEASGGGHSARARHYTGCRLNTLILTQTEDDPLLMGECHWQAGNATTWNNSTLTTDPTNYGTANMYDFTDTTCTYNGTSIREGLTSVHIKIGQGMEVVYGQQGSDSHLPQFLIDKATLVDYEVTLIFNVTSLGLWDDVKDDTGDKALVVKFQVDSNDYIQFTFTNAKPVNPQFPQPTPGGGFMGEVVFRPESLSVEVKDSIANY